MTIQPIVENAILHGIEPTGTYGEIRIGARLEASVLEEALERAKKERSQRARLTVADSEEFFQKKKQEEAANRALQEMILLKQREDDAAAAVLSDCGMLENYGYFYIPFDYSGMPDAGQMTKESRTELMRWIRELLQKTAENIYRSRYVLVDTVPAWHKNLPE